jgi:xanthine dehydrogenase accessory factor
MTDFFEQISEIQKRGDAAVLCIITKSKGSTPRQPGSKMLVFPDGKISGTIGGGETEANCIKEALKLFQSNEPKSLHYSLVNPEKGDPGVCGGELEIYLEPIGIRETVCIIGAGHVGKSVAFLANWLGFNVIVMDDREPLLLKEDYPKETNLIHCEPKSIVKFINFNQDNYILLTTRSLDIDLVTIPILLPNHPKYIGIIGSKKRWVMTQKGLIENGVEEELINTIFSPIGLDLGAETPQEIAISIMAEIMLVRNQKTGKHMSTQWRTI